MAVTGNTRSEFIQVAFSVPFGLPTSYADQRDGRLFHDIYPIEKNALAVSSQSSQVHLGFHTEMFFHPDPPDFLFLHCLRADPAGLAETGVTAVDDITALLTPSEIDELRRPLFALDLANLHGAYLHGGRRITEADPRPVLPILPNTTTPGADGRFRFEPGLTTPTTTAAAAAMKAADEAAEKAIVTGKLEARTMLIVDNRRTVHSRSPFVAAYDGTDRWLRRVMVSKLSDGSDLGFHERLDLEMCRAWRDRGALIRSVAYSKDGGAA
ncbi:TauD/TfdA family dioxygenase [uncultured Nocardioides sp.]|uniref:TauD/TfdA family dioxygenase n=1 Tax=uncultured Nocardioides sp. TaxID=198441 RepID=UPI00261DD56D|nr:TauD/TfdA family dioxygenase [uncultured Nocardioides sp.]